MSFRAFERSKRIFTEPVEFRSVITGAFEGAGLVQYVDPVNGSDTQNGDSWENALATLAAAMANTTTDNGDVIYVAPGNHDVTSSVQFDTRGVSVIASPFGHPGPVKGESFMINADASFTDGPAATVTQPTRFVGVGFASRDLTQENIFIDSGGAGGFNGGFNEFINCRFPAWYGAIDAGVRAEGGSLNHWIGCTWDGLFGGYGTGGIVFEQSDNGIAPVFSRVLGNYFSGVGSTQHAVVHAAGSVPEGFVYAHNYLEGGFTGNLGAFLDNNNVAARGLIADNWVAPLANQAAAFENLTNSTIGFADNHYEEA